MEKSKEIRNGRYRTELVAAISGSGDMKTYKTASTINTIKTALALDSTTSTIR